MFGPLVIAAILLLYFANSATAWGFSTLTSVIMAISMVIVIHSQLTAIHGQYKDRKRLSGPMTDLELADMIRRYSPLQIPGSTRQIEKREMLTFSLLAGLRIGSKLAWSGIPFVLYGLVTLEWSVLATGMGISAFFIFFGVFFGGIFSMLFGTLRYVVEKAAGPNPTGSSSRTPGRPSWINGLLRSLSCSRARRQRARFLGDRDGSHPDPPPPGPLPVPGPARRLGRPSRSPPLRGRQLELRGPGPWCAHRHITLPAPPRPTHPGDVPPDRLRGTGGDASRGSSMRWM